MFYSTKGIATFIAALALCITLKAQENFIPHWMIQPKGGFTYAGINWGSGQIKPVMLVNILLQDEELRQTSWVGTEDRPTYAATLVEVQGGIAAKYYQIYALLGSGRFDRSGVLPRRYGLGLSAQYPITEWCMPNFGLSIQRDGSINGKNLVLLKYNNLSEIKREASEELILCYKDPNCSGAGFVTTQTRSYMNIGCSIHKKLGKAFDLGFTPSVFFSLKNTDKEKIYGLDLPIFLRIQF